MNLTIIRADYHNPQHQMALIQVLDNYAKDPMGGGKGLADSVKQNLLKKLVDFTTAFSVLAFVNEQPAGLINCFETLSTFKCKPLINIHDVAVMPKYRGLGISQKMLQEVENIAREKNCCKLTLEVLEGNPIARHVYQKFGFSGYELDPEFGNALFWEKPL